MTLYFQYNNTGEVAAYSKALNVCDTLDQIQLDVTKEEHDKLIQNWKPYIKNGKLCLDKTTAIANDERARYVHEKKEMLRKRIDNGSVNIKDIVELLSDILV